jgi:hypothetical protein
VIDVARAMMEIYKESINGTMKAAISESSLFKVVYKLIFNWPPA